MVTVRREIPDRNGALLEVMRVLKPCGFLAVSELFQDFDYAWKSSTVKLSTDAGLVSDKVSGNFFNYAVKFRTASRGHLSQGVARPSQPFELTRRFTV